MDGDRNQRFGTAGAQVVSALKQTGEATTHSILFAFNSAELDREARPVLDSVAQYLKANPKVHLEIQGHTDSIGGAVYNLALSQKRADAMKAYLTATGIHAKRLAAKGIGLTVPVGITPRRRAARAIAAWCSGYSSGGRFSLRT